MTKLFGTNGVRGIVNLELTPKFIRDMSKAIGTFFKGKTILVGIDARVSSKMIKDIVIPSLIDSGVNVYDGGFAPTPAHQYAVKYYNLDGGVVVTASHNPPEYNGLKVLGEKGMEVPHEYEDLIEEIYYKRSFVQDVGHFSGALDVIKPYVNNILSLIDSSSVRERRFKIVTDTISSVAGLTVPLVLRELNVKMISVNGQLDGTFSSRNPEPLPDNLQNLGKFVRSCKCDFGVAFDGDADRSIFISDNGEVVWGDRSGALLAEHSMRKHGKGVLVVGVSASRVVEYPIKKLGGEVIWTKVGSVIITHKILELESKGMRAFGLEENGGFFYTPHQPARDGTMSLALMLEALSKMNIGLSEYNNSLPRLFMVKDKLPCSNEKKPYAIEKIIKHYSSLGYEYDTIDGIRVWFNENEWILIRPSGTEPFLRIFAESTNPEKTKDLLAKAKLEVSKLI
ncbi:MAG: phosphoglucosamine mutase [Thermoprotei archaeon]